VRETDPLPLTSTEARKRGSIHPLWVRGVLSRGLKRPVGETDPLPLTSAEDTKRGPIHPLWVRGVLSRG
jgi:hypothetical protein